MSNIFRVFVSSTFSDMVAERNALQKQVFPRLRDWCRTQGVTFQAIDLRWGISQEAGLNQRATDVCLNEISRCQKSTRRPNFLLLMGDRYGWRPLPDDIPAGEWDVFSPHITNPDDQNLLNRWYKCDDNAAPPIYVLQKRTGEFVDYPRWSEVENRLQTILWDAIRGLGWDDRTRMKYETSVTEQEIQAGIFDSADDGAICFFRTIHDLPDDAKDYRDVKKRPDGTLYPDTDAQARLTALKNRIRAHIPNNVHEYEATWQGDAPMMDINVFCERVYAVLQKAIEAELTVTEMLTPQQIERNAHAQFLSERKTHVVGRDAVLLSIAGYLKEMPENPATLPTKSFIGRLFNKPKTPPITSLASKNKPFVVYGQSGVGKSTIMARAIPEGAIYRFIGVTPKSSDIRQVLYDLCEEIAERYGTAETVPQDYEELIEVFTEFLASATGDKPLVIFLDALDQLSNTDIPMNLHWLPKELPAHVQLVVSVIPSAYLTALQRQLPADNLIEIPPLAQDDAGRLLDDWLIGAGRTLQPHQRHEVMHKFAHTGLPLYLKLAFEEAKLWHSYDSLMPLREDVPSLIRDNLFGRLSDKAEHGELLVNRSIAYLRASRNGLTDDEILDVLSHDSDYWDDFYAKSYHKEALDIMGSVPVVIWSRLHFDLAPYMMQRSADGTALWAFFHRQFNEVADATYLGDDVRKARHAHLAHYFMGQDLYMGDTPNARKGSEQAYQQAMADMKNDYVATLTTYKFLEASLNVNGVLALIEDCGRIQDKTVRLIQSALSMSAHVLVNDKRALAHQLAGRLMHYYREVEEIRIFLDGVMQTPNNLFPLDPTSNYHILSPAGGMMIRTMKHEGSVDGAMQLSDGRILSWSSDNTLRLWGTDGVANATLTGHVSDVAGAIQLASGQILSWSDNRVWGEDCTLRLWDMDGTPIATLTGHTSVASGAIQLRSGHILSWAGNKYSENKDSTLRLWDVDGMPITTLTGHKGRVHGATQLGDKRILSWSEDGTLRLWNEDGRRIATLTGHTSEVAGATQLGDKRILSWSEDGTLRLWNEDGSGIATLTGHTGRVSSAIQLAGGRILSWSEDNTLRLWNVDGTPIATLTGHTDYVTGVTQLVDGHILSWSFDSTLRLWAVNGEAITTLTGHRGWVNGAIQLADGWILSWGSDMTPRLWDVDGTPITILTGHTNSVRGATQLVDGHILSWGFDSTLRLWDVDGVPITTLTGHTGRARGTIQLVDGRVLSWSGDSTLRLWDADGTPITTLIGHTNFVLGATQLADGRILSWAGGDRLVKDNTLRLWNMDGEAIAEMSGHTDDVRGAIQLTDGRFLSWSDDNTLRLWNMDGEAIATLMGHTGNVRGATQLMDGRFLSWSFDNTLRLWNGNGEAIAPLVGHMKWINGATQLADDRILSWSEDSTLRLWDMGGEAIDVLKQDYGWGNRDIIGAWANKHGLTLDDIYLPEKGQDTLMAGGRVKRNRTDLIIYDPKTDIPIHTFYGDAFFECVAVLDGGRIVVAGDDVGRVLFLRWVGE